MNKPNKNGSGLSALKAVLLTLIMAILICALSLFVLYSAGVITFKETSSVSKLENKNGHINLPDNPKPEKPSKQETPSEDIPAAPEKVSKGIIVIDPGHGVSSSSMTDDEKFKDGWIKNAKTGGWGEWRHFKSNTIWQDCQGSGCTGRAPKNGSCWYPIGNGDRDIEPEINMNNALATKKHLEEMGYTVRITRTAENNPSMTKRVEFCYPNNDISVAPDADLFVCLHSNAGGGQGSYYISLSGLYDQAGIPADYIEKGNAAGKYINDRIISETSLSASSGGRYDGYPELVLFCKSPIPIAYMEIGFFDNASDLSILRAESDKIGKAVANGINDYMTNKR